MRLYSVQPKEVYDEIMQTGTFVCDIEKSIYNDETNFINAYNWLIKQMDKTIPHPENISYPVWAWYKIDGSNELPDFNNTYINYTDCYLLELEIPDKEVLLSDFDAWHMVLNNCYYNDKEDELEWDIEENRYDNLPNELKLIEKYNSWEKIFDISKSDYVQAVFWKINKSNLIAAHKIYESIDLDDCIEMLSPEFTDEDRARYKYEKERIPELLNNYIENYNTRCTYLKSNTSDLNLEETIDANNFALSNEIKEKIDKISNFFSVNIIPEIEK